MCLFERIHVGGKGAKFFSCNFLMNTKYFKGATHVGRLGKLVTRDAHFLEEKQETGNKGPGNFLQEMRDQENVFDI